MTNLQALLNRLEKKDLLVATRGRFDSINESTIDHLANDSREVGPGGLFAALRGEAADGHLFIDKAVYNGAIAILCEALPEDVRLRDSGTVFAQVRDSKAALAEVAAAFYDDPSHNLKLIGVTGTNGKTTTTFLLHHLLTRLSEKAGLIGTVEYRIGDRRIEATHTTPDAIALQKLLRQMVDAGCTACAMEVSSHALVQERVGSTRFDVGLFSNLTQDHLDYHETFEAYRDAKKILFDRLPADATALYNLDDPAGTEMIADTAATPVAYGTRAGADIQIEVLENTLQGLHLRIIDEGMPRERRFRLVGQFNAYNLAAAYGAARALGCEADEILDALAEAPPVPGRFEQMVFEGGTTAVIDYAHTPDALENVLKTIRATMPAGAELWCIFGCGGDRDRTKRPLMGEIAERYAHHVIATSDNPRTEDPEAILADIREGLLHPEEALWIVDRREAIREAAHRARPGDVVLVAGKGHEPYQILGTEKVHFDDREEVLENFRDRGKKAG